MADAAAYLATRFDRLRHPDGTESRFAIFNTFGQPDRVAQAQRIRAQHHAEAMINELQLAGFTITHQDDSNQPAPQQGAATIICKHCGHRLGALMVGSDMTIPLTAEAQRALATLSADCDDHKGTKRV